MEVESTSEGGESTADAEKLSTTRLMDMVWRLQQDQRAWLEAQQRMQEEMMLKAQQEMLDAVLSAREASSPVATERRVKPPKPTLQKL